MRQVLTMQPRAPPLDIHQGADDVPEPGGDGWVEGVAVVALRLDSDFRNSHAG